MDSALFPKGVQRCSMGKFLLGISLAGAVLLWGVIGMLLCWIKGLNQTNMNDYYGFALWIWADLAVIALGGGAFFTGLLKYIFGIDELKNIINLAVLIGFICYSSALLILAIDVGQPLRSWFIFWHANVHSMLTEVAFCLSVYFAVLTIEYIPLILENRQLDKVPFIHNLTHNMHHIMAVFAATGAFLSFFHQGSLGGVPGVLFGRPFAFREHILVWPFSFFLVHLVGGRLWPLFYVVYQLDHRENLRQTAGQGKCETVAGKDIRVDDHHVHHRQDCRHCVLGDIDGPGKGLYLDGLLFQQCPVRYLDSVRRNCALRCGTGADSDQSQIKGKSADAAHCDYFRSHRRESQSLGDGPSGHGRAGNAF